ncbi:hypothetical protein SESBI_18438 [Sesbania bispinosa]|nr:hypothetical protein SESBI_18438 [Sesbania bispinosa]
MSDSFIVVVFSYGRSLLPRSRCSVLIVAGRRRGRRSCSVLFIAGRKRGRRSNGAVPREEAAFSNFAIVASKQFAVRV